jgi:GTPase SAR1 family protein
VSDNFQIVICANKCDIFSKIEIKEEQIQEICLKYNTEYVLTSAKSGKNVYDSFMLLTGKIGDDLLNSNKSQKQRRKTVTIDKNNMSMNKSLIKDKGKKDGGCC